jgi:hypothetical protein
MHVLLVAAGSSINGSSDDVSVMDQQLVHHMPIH